jgi:hypothetical protein
MADGIWLVATKSRTGKSFMGKITDQQQLILKAYSISYVLSAAFMDPRMTYTKQLMATIQDAERGSQ